MSRVVWKFPLRVTGITAILVPRLARPRLIAIDPASGGPALWLELDPDAPVCTRRFVIYGTGHRIEGDGGYPSDIHVGSVIDRSFVWHVYEQRP